MVQFIDPVTNYGQLPGLMQGADPDYGMKLQQLQAARAFQGGVPTDANGNPDFMAMAKTLYSKGDIQNANQLMQNGMLMQSMNGASLDDPMGKVAAAGASSGAQPASGAPSTAAINPDVAAYIKQRASALGINPNAALAVASSEGLRGFDPNRNANLGDGGSSAGPFQLHYGNVAPGANSTPGLGDDFTKATGLDARDPKTWQAQVDFALSNAAKNGWGAFHGAKAIGLGNWAGIDGAPQTASAGAPASAPANPASSQPAPTQIAMNGASDAPMPGVHPYGPQAAGAASPSPAAAGGASGAQTAPQPAPQAAPPQAAAAAQTVPGMPQNYPGGAGQYLIDLETRLSHLPNTPMAANYAKALEARIKQVEATLSPTNEQKNAADPTVQASQMKLAEARGGARAAATAQFALVPVQQPDGSVTLMPKTQALAQAAAGNAPIKSLPGYVTSGQQNLLTKLNDGSAAYTERQIASTRLDALGDLLSTYQTGANSDAFNHAAAYARSLGIAIPNSATINPAAMQQFTKDAYANVLSNMKEQGNKQFVSEVQSAINSNPNTDLQPEANAAMIAQMKGIQNFHDQNFQDYANWYDGNKGASNDAQFQIAWAKQHPLDQYIQSARKNIAPLGVPVPPKNQLVDGQAYMLKNGVKARWNASRNGFVPMTSGAH